MLETLCVAWTKYVVDGAVLAVFLAFAFVCAKKGFVQCFFGFISTLVAFILALLFMKTVLSVTGGLFGLQGAIERGATGALSKIKGFSVDISSVGLTEALTGKLPKFIINMVVDSVGNSELPQGTTIASSVGVTVAKFSATLLSFLLVFALSKLALKLVERLLSSVTEKLPLVGAVNTILGLLVGILEGLLLASGVIAVLALFPSESMANFFNECILVKWLYNSNPLHVIFSWFLS